MPNIVIKRIYEPYVASDGYRILVDRLWPRGLAKEAAHVDYWAKGLSPSTAIRKAFNHQDDQWDEFKEGYLKELDANQTVVVLIKQIQHEDKTTLLYGAKDEVHNNAVILRDFLKEKAAKQL